MFFPEGDNTDVSMLLGDGQSPIDSLFTMPQGMEDRNQEDLYSPVSSSSSSSSIVPAESGTVSQSSPSDSGREDGSGVVSMNHPAEAVQQCARCRLRLEEMRASGSEAIRRAAALWAENWAAGGTACFGACDSPEFCARHGYPLPQCAQRFPGQPHKVVVYRGKWVGARDRAAARACADVPSEWPNKRARPDDENNAPVPAPVSASVPVPAPVLEHEPAPGAVCECRERLARLLEVPWVEAAPAFAALVRERWAASAGGCLGFCRTPYLCRVHACPAVIVAGRHPSRYQCLHGSHDGIANKGRHHADYCFYCADPACCGGKWYSRDETHARTLRRHQRADSSSCAAAAPAALPTVAAAEEERIKPEHQFFAIPELAVPDSNTNNDLQESEEEENEDGSRDNTVCVKHEEEEDEKEEEKQELVETTTERSPRRSEMLVMRRRVLHDGLRMPRRGAVLALAAAACVLVAVALVAVGVRVGAGHWPPGRVAPTGADFGRAGTVPAHWQLCWSLVWADGAHAPRQESGCQRCVARGAELRCTGGEGTGTLFTVAATRAQDAGRFERVRLETADRQVITASDVAAPWAFRSTDARRISPNRRASGVISELVIPQASAQNKRKDARPESRNIAHAKMWFGFLAPLD